MKLKEEHTQYRMDIDELKDKLHLCKASHTRITDKNEELKKEVAGYEEYQNEVDTMENNLENILEEAGVKDPSGDPYLETRHYDVCDIVKGLIAEKKK